jgi:hypothetical protein
LEYSIIKSSDTPTTDEDANQNCGYVQIGIGFTTIGMIYVRVLYFKLVAT